MRKILFILFYLIIGAGIHAQELNEKISDVNLKIDSLYSLIDYYKDLKQDLLMNKIISDISKMGYPTSEQLVKHSALILDYDEKTEQARWVMHMILPEVKDGGVFRTNDFRTDPLVTTGTAVQEDYFLTDTLNSGEVKYDGFGYDRGHMAASADYRWSEKALSETYFYSNMSPQLPYFNRVVWAELEDHLRKYVIDKNVPLYVITAPVFDESSTKIQRAINNVMIPSTFVKIALDPINKHGIAFILDHTEDEVVLETKAVTIDQAEKLLGFDVFPGFNQYEDKIDKLHWFDNLKTGDVLPFEQDKLPRGHFNTLVGGKRIGKESKVCGTVVSTKISRAGHLWINLDKKFPNQIFSSFIRKDDLTNFSYDAEKYLLNKKVCIEGKVENMNGTPTINVDNSRQIEDFKN